MIFRAKSMSFASESGDGGGRDLSSFIGASSFLVPGGHVAVTRAESRPVKCL